MECGFKFLGLEDMITEKEIEAKGNLIFCIGLAVAGIASIAAIWPAIVLLLAAGGGFLQYKESKKDVDNLMEKGYDAACYLKKKK